MGVRGKKPQAYVDNKEFLRSIVAYKGKCDDAKREGREKPRIPDFCGKCIYLIAERVSYMPKFANYSFREEMVSDGIENCVMYFDRFDPAKSNNPFAYFTTVVMYAFIRRINKEEKNRYTTYKFFDTTMILTDALADEEGPSYKGAYDNINAFIANFEAKEADKRVKKAAKRGRSVDDEDSD